jgi:uncharacterized protein YecT (DUF1311 family)
MTCKGDKLLHRLSTFGYGAFCMKIGVLVISLFTTVWISPTLMGKEAQRKSDPFFDCARAQTKVQRTICGDAGFLQWDTFLWQSYNQLLAQLSGAERMRALREQNEWLEQREIRCADAPPNPGFPNADPTPQCLTEMFAARNGAIKAAYTKTVCQSPDKPIMGDCRHVGTVELPEELRDLLEDPENPGGAFVVDLNADRSPEMLVCSRSPSHGPCSALIAGKTNSKWIILSSERVQGFSPPCDNSFVVLESMTNGYHDICFLQEQTPIWKFSKGKYRPVTKTKNK